jgi:hypothetical protein
MAEEAQTLQAKMQVKGNKVTAFAAHQWERQQVFK